MPHVIHWKKEEDEVHLELLEKHAGATWCKRILIFVWLNTNENVIMNIVIHLYKKILLQNIH